MPQPHEIKFGTDGWRGLIADDFTFDNVALVGRAIRLYLQETGQGERQLLIGYDRRFNAELYAAHIAGELAELGQPVVMHDSPCPTPAIAYGVRHLSAAGAVMLTASHNPYYWQGLKFIPHFAGPALPETTDRITALIGELAPAFTPPAPRLEYSGERINLRDVYFAQLDRLVNSASLTSLHWKILYNPMHGVGAGWLDGYLGRAGVQVETVNSTRDVYFGGTLPDPSPRNLVPLTPLLADLGCKLLAGTDGDADRFGLVDTEGRYFSANQALPLLADFLVTYKQQRGPLVRTAATGHLLDKVALQHSLPLIETKVGFKYIGEQLLKGALIGGEESGGISIAGHVPEKDGMLSTLLMLELAATTGEDLHSLQTELMRQLGPHYYNRVDLDLTDAQKQLLMGTLRAHTDSHFAGLALASMDQPEGVRFYFDNGAWLMARPSGTEPVIRIYMEAPGEAALAALQAAALEELHAIAGEFRWH